MSILKPRYNYWNSITGVWETVEQECTPGVPEIYTFALDLENEEMWKRDSNSTGYWAKTRTNPCLLVQMELFSVR